jgi:tartrate dehydrogenase/decarboxylase/D-malate dehydrogenase
LSTGAPRRYRVALIPGDGVGREVVPEGVAAILAAAAVTGAFEIEIVEYPWSCEWHLEHGRMMPPDGLDQLRDSDAIYLGAVGFPGVPDHVSLWGLLLPIRQGFDQYVNLRPIRLLPGIVGPLAGRTPADIDFVCVRENTEGEYTGIGGRLRAGAPDEVATQTAVFTRRGTERVVRYAFELARARKGRLTSATKSNALNHSMVFWDEVVAAVAADYPGVDVTSTHVDALAARFVLAPQLLDVVVASNLFGDILTDLGGALQGSLGIPASGSINPEHTAPSMFEPVHGSAPGRAGKGIANPIAAIWAASMMLDHLGEPEAAALVMRAIERTALIGPRTADLGGRATTREVGQAVVAAILGMDDTPTHTPSRTTPNAS